MGGPTSYDWQAICLAVASAAVLVVGLGIKISTGRAWILGLTGLFSGTLGLASGFYAQHTGLRGLVEGILGWSPWAALVVGAVVLAVLALACAALIPILHDAAVTPIIVAALILMPVYFGLNPMPGRFDGQALGFLHTVAKPTLALVAGEFGAI